MHPHLQEVATAHSPESLVERLRGEPGVMLLRTRALDQPDARYSFVVARPFLRFRSSGSRLVVTLLGRMEREDSRYGLATMCVGVGQGTALIIERV